MSPRDSTGGRSLVRRIVVAQREPATAARSSVSFLVPEFGIGRARSTLNSRNTEVPVPFSITRRKTIKHRPGNRLPAEFQGYLCARSR